MDKKKNLQKSPEEIEEIATEKESSHDQPTFVTEVVEEVGGEEEVSGNPVEEKEMVSVDTGSEGEEKEQEKEKEEQTETRFAEKKEYRKEFEEEPRPEPNKRQMVEDIYSSKQTHNVVDIAINKKQTNQPAIVWAIIIIAVALVTGGGMILLTKTIGENKNTAVKPTPTVAQTTTPPPVPVEIKRGDLTVQVLNGGGTAGAGSKMKTFLTGLGYTVSNVGNTDEYTFEKTEIEVKVGKEGALELLKNDLAKEYSLGTMSSTLASDSVYDARVTVGK
jgi:hypothetical protein